MKLETRNSKLETRPAFSLIELLVVIAIIGLVTSISLPAVKALAADNSRAQAVNQIRALLAQARGIARAEQRQAGVVFFDETFAYSSPVHNNQTAMQLIVEDYNQAQYNPLPDNTVFLPYSTSRQYLPAAVKVAALNDDPTRGVMTGDEPSSTLGVTRVILFNADGQLLTRHGLARPDMGSGSPGTYPKASADWRFLTKRDTHANVGVSSPGIFLFDSADYAAQNIPPDHSGDAQRTTWIQRHASVILINANTGALLP